MKGVVFSVARGSPLYTLLIVTYEAIYQVPVNNSVTPPIYGNKTTLIPGKLINMNVAETRYYLEYCGYIKDMLLTILCCMIFNCTYKQNAQK